MKVVETVLIGGCPHVDQVRDGCFRGAKETHSAGTEYDKRYNLLARVGFHLKVKFEGYNDTHLHRV